MTLLQKIVKRIFDIFISIIAILTFCPVSLVIAILIKLESQGPVFFTQTRVGKDGRDFIIYKFRTMRVQEATEEQKA
ncbi:MAG TPA: sugar transferase, partial [Candidatus Eremiobacteraeota bacterium]|nr:sugar transferase [Candidatus Eremiobacteraeota bacterium]